MKRYKALKDVPYWGIKAGEIYSSNTCYIFIDSPNTTVLIQPLLEAGIIEEYEPRKPLTRGNLKYAQEYRFLDVGNADFTNATAWGNDKIDQNLARVPIFRPDEQKIATDCYKAMCDFGFQWVKENYSKYY